MRYITKNVAPARPIMRAISDHSWHVRALCHDLPADEADKLFFPTPRDHKTIAAAKSLCNACPVKKDCFQYACDNDQRIGIWGGLTERERRPWHNKVGRRLDYDRVREVLAGRDLHLSVPERDTVIRHAYVRGWEPEHLAFLLKADIDWIRDLLREARHAVADRDRYHGADEDDENTDAEDSADDHEESVTTSIVPAQVHTDVLIAALGKAA